MATLCLSMNISFTVKDFLLLLAASMLLFGSYALASSLNIPYELVAIPMLTIILLEQVIFPGRYSSKEFRNTKIIGFIGLLVLSTAILINHFIVSFLEYHGLMIFAALLPAFFYSVAFEKHDKKT